jgi:fructose-1,6-bisphosphatase, class II
MLPRDLTLQLARVTEIAALEGSAYLGKGDKNIVDQAAVDGMHRVFNTLDIDGRVVIGEGEMDEAPMLYIGEHVGKQGKNSPKVDIAVDPIDGTECVAKGINNTIAVVAIGAPDTLLNAPDMYMEKIAVGPMARGTINLNDSLEDNLNRVSKALNKCLNELTIVILDRERHSETINEIRNLGCRIKLIGEGDVAAAIATCLPDKGVDVLIGTGGAPEGVLAAAALKCLGGDFQGRLVTVGYDGSKVKLNKTEQTRLKDMGITDINKVLTIDDLVRTDDVFFAATGVTDSDILGGVTYLSDDKARTHTMILRSKTGTIRFIEAYHDLSKKNHYFKHLRVPRNQDN